MRSRITPQDFWKHVGAGVATYRQFILPTEYFPKAYTAPAAAPVDGWYLLGWRLPRSKRRLVRVPAARVVFTIDVLESTTW